MQSGQNHPFSLQNRLFLIFQISLRNIVILLWCVRHTVATEIRKTMRYRAVSDVLRLSWTIRHTITPTPSYVICRKSICFFHFAPLSIFYTFFRLVCLLYLLPRALRREPPSSGPSMPTSRLLHLPYRSPLEMRGKVMNFQVFRFFDNETSPLYWRVR